MSSKARLSLVLILLVAAAAFGRLGVWQFDRLKQRRAANAQALAARSLPQIDLAAGPPAAQIAGRRVRAVGVYDRTHEIVLRGQALREVPGVELLTPLRLWGAGDTAVLVDRGFVPTPDAATLPPDASGALEDPGEREVRGLALPLSSSSDSGQPVVTNGRTTWRRLDLATLRGRLPYPVLPLYVLQLPDSTLPSFPRRREAPELDDGPHLSYAIQWFAFALMAVVFAGIFLKRGRTTGSE